MPTETNGSFDEFSEEERIQEYLKRGDTAVIFPEPVDSNLGKKLTCKEQLNESEVEDHSLIDETDDNQSMANNNSKW